MDSVLRPRDIQARVRAGETPETVAAAAGTTVEKIMGFAAPALAERAHMAQQAQKSSVRRRGSNGPTRHLADAVAERLDPDTVEWDAWRRDDGKWTLIAEYGAGATAERAEFVFDSAGRYVVADNEESRRLIGERPAGEPQLALGDDAIEVVTGRPATALRAVPAQPEPKPEPSDWMVTQASERPVVEKAPEPEPVAAEPVDTLFESPAVSEPEAAPSPEPAPQKSSKRSQKRARGRASVPSWDEIMFGSTGTDTKD
jgi:hypothetical protein